MAHSAPDYGQLQRNRIAGEELVGRQPLAVQRLLAVEIQIFLEQVEAGEALQGSTHQQVGDLRLHRLDRHAAERLRKSQ